MLSMSLISRSFTGIGPQASWPRVQIMMPSLSPSWLTKSAPSPGGSPSGVLGLHRHRRLRRNETAQVEVLTSTVFASNSALSFAKTLHWACAPSRSTACVWLLQRQTPRGVNGEKLLHMGTSSRLWVNLATVSAAALIWKGEGVVVDRIGRVSADCCSVGAGCPVLLLGCSARLTNSTRPPCSSPSRAFRSNFSHRLFSPRVW